MASATKEADEALISNCELSLAAESLALLQAKKNERKKSRSKVTKTMKSLQDIVTDPASNASFMQQFEEKKWEK